MEEEHSTGMGYSAGARYQVAARRYRPQTFGELVGQPHIAHALSNAITSGRIGHAYLFTGTRGVGKTSTARIFAKALNCVEGPTLTPCGECDSCKSISTGDDIDAIEIDGASNGGIDQIRLLRQNATICPSRSRFKIYIIDEVHMVSPPAFNALLKTLEEPPEHVKFIFCTTEPSKIPVTILSRCQRFDFAGIETKQIAGRLAAIAENEKVTADDGVFDTLARRAAGSMRDAQSLLEQLLSFAPQHISLADVHDMLGTANDQMLFRLLDGILHGEQNKIFAELESAASQGVDFGILVEQMLGLYRDLLVTASGGDANLVLYCSPQQFEQVKTLAAELGLHRILAAMQILDHTQTRMQRSTQSRVLIELALIRIANLDHFHQIATLLEQLRSGQVTLPAMLPAQASVPESVKSAQRVIVPPKPGRIERIGLNGLDDHRAKTIWFDVAESIPGALGGCAMKCKTLRFEQPNFFIVFFDNKMAKDACEKESARLQSVLSQAVGDAVKIRFELDESRERADRTSSQSSDREQYLAVREHPLVKDIQETFGVTLREVRR